VFCASSGRRSAKRSWRPIALPIHQSVSVQPHQHHHTRKLLSFLSSHNIQCYFFRQFVLGTLLPISIFDVQEQIRMCCWRPWEPCELIEVVWAKFDIPSTTVLCLVLLQSKRIFITKVLLLRWLPRTCLVFELWLAPFCCPATCPFHCLSRLVGWISIFLMIAIVFLPSCLF
jgi:hypothetical protein